MISIKKLATVGAAAGLLLGSAMPAFASHWDLKIEQENENTLVDNDLVVISNSGDNWIGVAWDDVEGEVEDNDITTGNSSTGTVTVSNYVNSNKVDLDDCNCFEDVKIEQENENTDVLNDLAVLSDTGSNLIGVSLDDDVEDDVERNEITTGVASTGNVSVTNKVNKNVVLIDD